jgi:hypothetical protein
MANRGCGSGRLGATKRTNVTFHDRDVVMKKVKTDLGLPPKLGQYSLRSLQEI